MKCLSFIYWGARANFQFAKALEYESITYLWTHFSEREAHTRHQPGNKKSDCREVLGSYTANASSALDFSLLLDLASALTHLKLRTKPQHWHSKTRCALLTCSTGGAFLVEHVILTHCATPWFFLCWLHLKISRTLINFKATRSILS